MVRDVDMLASHANTLVLEKLARHEQAPTRELLTRHNRGFSRVFKVKPQRTLKVWSGVKYNMIHKV